MIQNDAPRSYGYGFMPAWDRPWLRYIDSPDTGGAVDAPEAPEAPDAPEPEGSDEPEESGDAFDADKAREKIRKINSENRNLRQRASDAEKKAQEAEGASEKLTALEAENLRLRIAVKHGLPEALIKRLSGTTEEEILQDAEELMELFGGKKPPTQQPKEKLRSPSGDVSKPDTDVESVVERVFNS